MTEQVKDLVSELNLQMLNSITFLVYELESGNKNDLFMLSKLLDEESLNNLINYYNGANIRIPTVEDFKRSTILGLFYYLMDVKNLSFSESKTIIESYGYKIEDDSISLGKRVSSLRKQLANRILNVIEDIQNGRE